MDPFTVGVMLFVGGMTVSYLLRPKTPEIQTTAPPPPAIGEVKGPTATAGRDIPVVFGTRVIDSPNVVWFGDYKIEAYEKDSSYEKETKRRII